jgi:AcrR family transcriptional regulator
VPKTGDKKRRLIVDAARRVMEEKGLAGATTREIALEVGCADGTLYVHFPDRIQLFLAVLRESLPSMTRPLSQLAELAGRRTVRANLETVVLGALRFMSATVPLVASTFAEPALLKEHRKELAKRNEGPHLSLAAVESYLRAEQQLGRIDQRIVPRAIYNLLFGACLHRVFLSHFLGRAMDPPDDVFVKELVSTAMRGLRPKERSSSAVY